MNRSGRCGNVGECAMADARVTMEIAATGPFQCPVCHAALEPMPSPGAGNPAWRAGRYLALVLAFGGLLLFALGQLFTGPTSPLESGVAAGPAPLPPGSSAEGAVATAPAPPEKVVYALPPAGAIVMLRVHGSSTIGSSLAPKWAELFLKRLGAVEVHHFNTAQDEETVLGRMPGGELRAIQIAAHGSGTAFQDLETGACDIGMASRRVKDAEAARLQTAGFGDLKSPACENVVGLDGVALVVNPLNAIDNLTAEQAKKIYAGEITDWAQVGAATGPIFPITRAKGSGTRDTFESVIMTGTPIFSGAREVADSPEIPLTVAKVPGGIGYVGLADALKAASSIKMVRLADAGATAFFPSIFTIRKEDYLLHRRLYLYVPTNTRNAWASQFIAFTLSDEGQRAVDAVGYVGLGLGDLRKYADDLAKNPPSAETAPPEYAQLTREALNLPVNIRFNSGSAELDNLALRDLVRLVLLINQPENRARQIILVGFADSQGEPAANLTLSRARAQTVADLLAKQDLESAQVIGFGQAVPVATNATAEGRRANRRVEIWLKAAPH